LFGNNFGPAKPTEPRQNLAKLVLAITRSAAPALNLSKGKILRAAQPDLWQAHWV
jgi:hypothetical protein